VYLFINMKRQRAATLLLIFRSIGVLEINFAIKRNFWFAAG